eukprot:gb/GECH01003372.1/.p1 GENE.gb/GECH01003372.1/~~gb/GECH01003372.1/.p1  ORF type:complete len:247 (+),score=72.90 gb/GECH01003372.1/:1-741(+)
MKHLRYQTTAQIFTAQSKKKHNYNHSNNFNKLMNSLALQVFKCHAKENTKTQASQIYYMNNQEHNDDDENSEEENNNNNNNNGNGRGHHGHHGHGVPHQLRAIRHQVTDVQDDIDQVIQDLRFVKNMQRAGNLPDPSSCETLDCVRNPINVLDDTLMNLISIRLGFALQAGEIKYEDGKPVLDSSREDIVLDNAGANAVANGMPEYVGRTLWGNQCMLYVSKRLQVETLNEKYPDFNEPIPQPHDD